MKYGVFEGIYLLCIIFHYLVDLGHFLGQESHDFPVTNSLQNLGFGTLFSIVGT